MNIPTQPQQTVVSHQVEIIGNPPPVQDLTQQQQQQQQQPSQQISNQPPASLQQQVPINTQDNSHQPQINAVPTSQQNPANVSPQQQPFTSLSAAATMIVEGISSVVNDAVAANVNEDGERSDHQMHTFSYCRFKYITKVDPTNALSCINIILTKLLKLLFHTLKLNIS